MLVYYTHVFNIFLKQIKSKNNGKLIVFNRGGSYNYLGHLFPRRILYRGHHPYSTGDCHNSHYPRCDKKSLMANPTGIVFFLTIKNLLLWKTGN